MANVQLYTSRLWSDGAHGKALSSPLYSFIVLGFISGDLPNIVTASLYWCCLDVSLLEVRQTIRITFLSFR